MATDTRTLDVLDRPEVLNVLYHPRRDIVPQTPGPTLRPVRIPVDGDTHVGGIIYPAGENAPAILYFHGNGEIASDYIGLSDLYTGMGITLFVVDFRGYGISDGVPTATSQLRDAVAVYDQARQILEDNGCGTDPLFVMGRSMGSASAVEIARHAGDAIRGLILESGFSETIALVERLGYLRLPDADEARDGFNNLQKIAEVTVPTLVIHGQQDWIIPIDDGRALHEGSGAESRRLVEIPGAGHNDLLIFGQRPYFGAIHDLVGEFGG